MAKTVYVTEEIQLTDGTTVLLKPLVIAGLRRFLKEWSKAAEAKSDDEVFDTYIVCCGIGMEKQLKKALEFDLFEGSDLTDEYREFLEDNLELETIYKILDVTGGIKLNDPNLVEAVKAMQEQSQE